MNKAQEIEKYVKQWFHFFGFNYRILVGTDENEDGEFVDAPIAVGDGLVMENVERAAEALGITTDDILSMRDSAPRSRLKKFPRFNEYVNLTAAYTTACENGFYAPGIEVERLRAAIFGQEHAVANLLDRYPSRFDFDSVPSRLLALLKEYNTVFPGVYHTGAAIHKIRVSTEYFFHFAEISKLCRCFLSFVERAEELFYKALKTRLIKTEISEYNLLVSCIGLTDAFMTSHDFLYYSKLMKRREVYKKDNLPSFFSYVRLSRKVSFSPYRCAEFVADRELVQRFVLLYPSMKSEMRRYALEAANYKCTYRWSDEPEREMSDDALNTFIEGKLSIEELSARTGLSVTYVPKTPEELGSDGDTADQLRILSGPEALGGVAETLYPELDPQRMLARIDADRGVQNG